MIPNGVLRSGDPGIRAHCIDTAGHCVSMSPPTRVLAQQGNLEIMRARAVHEEEPPARSHQARKAKAREQRQQGWSTDKQGVSREAYSRAIGNGINEKKNRR